MAEAHEPDRMHAISDETWDTVDEVLDYARRRAVFEDVPLDKPLHAERSGAPRVGVDHREGIGARRATALFENVLAPACVTTDHPGYLSFIPSAPTKAAIAFDVVVSASSIYGGSWMEGSGAVFAENEVLHWLAAEFGLPDGRRWRLHPGRDDRQPVGAGVGQGCARRRNREAGRADPARWVVVCSAEAHSSIASAAAVMDVDVATAPPDAAGRLHGEAVARGLDEHGAAAFAVVATGGTTNFGIVDDIASIAAVTRDRDVWLHIDGAYGLAAMLVERMRPAFAGVEQADSLIVDPHKWLFAPFDACALIYRDPAVALARAHSEGRVPRHAHRDRRLEPVGSRDPAHPPRPRAAAVVLARDARDGALPRRDRCRHHARPADRRRDHGARGTLARPRSAALGRRVPPGGLDGRRLPGVVGPPARRAGGVRRAQLARRRAGAAVRDHQPAHDVRDAHRDPRHPALTLEGSSSAGVGGIRSAKILA